MAAAADFSLSPQAESVRQDLFQDVVRRFVSQGSLSRLSFVVIGEAGQGKSTLINGLVGKQIAKEGEEFDAGTTGLDCFKLNQNGVQVEIWDTPGFGMADPKEDEKTFQEMARDIKQVDLVLYCMRIDSKRWPKQNDKVTIVNITKIFTKKIWSHCLFVLTFANCVAEHLRPEDEQDDLASQFSRHCIKWEDRIREQLRKLVSLNNKELENIRAVPVGSYVSRKEENPWKLPDREDWFISFWMDCTSQMRESALPALLQLNRHRLTSYVPPTTEPDDLDQNSVDPNAIEVEVHDHPVPGTIEDEAMDSPQTDTTSNRSQTHITIGKPQTYATDDDGPRTQTASADQNIYDRSQEETRTAGGDSGLAAEDSDRTKPERPEERKIPVFLILRNKLDKADSGFWAYVSEFATTRGESVRGIGHTGGFIEGLMEFLGGRNRRKKHKQKKATTDVLDETLADDSTP